MPEGFEELPHGPGREAVYFNCTACHSIKHVTRQRMSRCEWDKLVGWMVGTNRMHPLSPWARTRIINCLAPRNGPAEKGDCGGLPADEGRDLVFCICQACHSLAIVKQQGLTCTWWHDTPTWMVEEQDMPEPDDEDHAIILEYLTNLVGPRSARC